VGRTRQADPLRYRDAVSGDDPGLAFRRFMRRYPTGVTVVTAHAGDVHHGMTANSVTTLSPDPPSYLICVAKDARLHPVVEEAKAFAINLLGADQADISTTFANKDLSDDERWATVITRHASIGAKLIDGCIGYAECRVTASFDGGTHTIYVGEVVKLEPGADDPPLIFHDGGYSRLATDD